MRPHTAMPWPDEEPAERLPPHSMEAEQATLGALLLDPAGLALVGDLLQPVSFFAHQHQAIFWALQQLQREGLEIDVITVFGRLQQAQREEGADIPYLNDLLNGVSTARNVRAYARVVAQHYAERQLIAGMDEAVKMAWQQDVPLAERVARIASVVSKAERQGEGQGLRVPVLRLDDLRKQAGAMKWTVKRIVPSASVGMLFGGSGTFKSFIALDLALHVAHGLPWLGRLTKPGPVLYVAAEGGAGLWARIDAWHRERGLRWQDVPLYVVPTAVDLTNDAWRVVESAQVLGVSPALVVVDTLSQTYTGEENSSNEMAAYLREIGLRFRELWGCAVLLVHHSGHSATERPRGSSAIKANIDFLLGVHRDEKERLATVSCVKQKDGDLFDDATFAMSIVKLGLDEDGDEITSLVARHLSSQEEVMAAQAAEAQAGRQGRMQLLVSLAYPSQKQSELRQAFYTELSDLDDEARKKAFGRALKKAQEAGLVELMDGVIHKVVKS